MIVFLDKIFDFSFLDVIVEVLILMLGRKERLRKGYLMCIDFFIYLLVCLIIN